MSGTQTVKKGEFLTAHTRKGSDISDESTTFKDVSLSRVQLFSLITAAIIVRITTLCSVDKTLANSNSRRNKKQN